LIWRALKHVKGLRFFSSAIGHSLSSKGFGTRPALIGMRNHPRYLSSRLTKIDIAALNELTVSKIQPNKRTNAFAPHVDLDRHTSLKAAYGKVQIATPSGARCVGRLSISNLSERATLNKKRSNNNSHPVLDHRFSSLF